jgi:hypothetical protein
MLPPILGCRLKTGCSAVNLMSHCMFALANRLGICKSAEQTAFVFLEPDTYKTAQLPMKTVESASYSWRRCAQLERELQQGGIAALVQGRPKKHILRQKNAASRLTVTRCLTFAPCA